MNNEYVPPTDVGKRRHAWFKERARTGMTLDDTMRLNDEALRLFPITGKERRLKMESLKAAPEFVL